MKEDREKEMERFVIKLKSQKNLNALKIYLVTVKKIDL